MAEAKVGGTWRTIRLPYARVSGTWRPCKQMYTKVGGVWKIVFDITAADPFDGSGSLSGALTPGYAPWETISGTWTKSGGQVSASDALDRVAALETGSQNIEVEIDRATPATGGTGIAFWIQDQSNWWGVRAYTEEYFVPFTNFTFYPFNCTDSFRTRTTNTVPGNANPVNYVSCYYVATQGAVFSSTNRVNSDAQTRTCTCSGASNANCQVNFGSTLTCVLSCTSNFTWSSPSANNPCNRTPDNRSFGTRTVCGPACGNCAPTTSFCAPSQSFIGNTPNCPSPTTFNVSGSFAGSNTPGCTCSYPTNYTNTANFNPPTSNPATCSCSDTQNSTSNYLSFISTSLTVPTCSNTQPCSSNNVTSYTLRTCSPCNSGCTTSFSGANAAYFKRGQIIRKSAGTLNVITNQDFGDVGNVYAYTSGNVINFRQYSSTGRGGTASNLVSYDAGAVTKGTKHGILVTAVPYTQTFSISRFKANL